jgi:hypothetical protein
MIICRGIRRCPPPSMRATARAAELVVTTGITVAPVTTRTGTVRTGTSARRAAGRGAPAGIGPHRRWMASPPSASITEPVAKAKAPDARPATTRATSSGSPQRRIGTTPSAISRS